MKKVSDDDLIWFANHGLGSSQKSMARELQLKRKLDGPLIQRLAAGHNDWCGAVLSDVPSSCTCGQYNLKHAFTALDKMEEE